MQERNESRRFIVRGRVQGVGFRWWARNTARGLGLRGFVTNRRDGSVELVAAGLAEALDRLALSLRSGPPLARVDAVEAEPAPTPDATDFEIR